MRHALICTALVAATFLVYFPVQTYDFVNLDDGGHVYNNPDVVDGFSISNAIGAFTSDNISIWVPLTIISFQVDVSLFGLDPGAMHRTNLFLHILNGLLLYALFVYATGATWPSALIAALFLLHPMHVESVVWITERKDTLSTAFWIGATFCYVGYAKRASQTLFAASIVLLALGLLAKPMLMTLPFTLLLLDLWPLNRFKSFGDARKLLLEKIPHFALILVFLIVNAAAQSENMALRSAVGLPFEWRLENAIVSYLVYLGKFVAPASMAVFYPHPMGAHGIGLVAGCALALLIVTGAAFAFYRRAPWFTAGWLWFMGTLVPVIGIVQIGVAYADRYTYVPYIGLFFAVAWGLYVLLKDRSDVVKRAAAVGAAAIVAIFAGIAARQVTHWENSETLFRHALAVTEENPMAHVKLGEHYRDHGDVDRAVKHFESALEISPENHYANTALGVILLERGNLDAAIAHFEAALLRPHAPVESRQRLAAAYYAAQNYEEAERVYRAQLDDPNIDRERLDESFFWLLRTLELAGKMDEHGKVLVQYQTRMPDSGRAEFEAARAAERRGDRPAAFQHYQRAVQLDEEFVPAWIQLGVAHGQAGRLDDAIHSFRKAVELDEQNAAAHQNLATALKIAGQPEQAAVHERRAAELMNQPRTLVDRN